MAGHKAAATVHVIGQVRLRQRGPKSAWHARYMTPAGRKEESLKVTNLLVLPDFELADKSLFYNELLVDLNLLNGAFWRYMPDFCPTSFLHMSYNIL